MIYSCRVSRAASPSLLSRALGAVRRASAAVYRGLLVALLGVVYVTVLPWFALAWRLRGAPPAGWRRRDNPNLASIERLRSLF